MRVLCYMPPCFGFWDKNCKVMLCFWTQKLVMCLLMLLATKLVMSVYKNYVKSVIWISETQVMSNIYVKYFCQLYHDQVMSNIPVNCIMIK